MKAHECYHCKQWVAEGEAHDCWTTTESALTKDLSEDLQDAYQRLREAAIELGEQRIYASHSSIMFARKTCFFFVRPKRNFLEVVIFLGRAIKSPKIKKIHESSRIKRAHVIQVRHRDEVEAPLTDWLLEAYQFEPVARSVKVSKAKTVKPAKKAKTPKAARKKKRNG
jgi:Domain of unknown function (DUF5655)